MLPRDERLGPRHHQRGDVIELERGALDRRGQVLHSPGEYLWRALLEPAGAADEPGDGVDAKPGGGDGRPLRRSRVVRADDQHEWTDPGALPRGPWAHEIPQPLRALGGGGTHQHYPPAALQRRLRFRSCHTVLGCQRAPAAGWYRVPRGKATAGCEMRDAGCEMGRCSIASRIPYPASLHLAVAHLASGGYRPAHAPGFRSVAQPATPRDVRDHRDRRGGEAPRSRR